MFLQQFLQKLHSNQLYIMKNIFIICILFQFCESNSQTWTTDLQIALSEANRQNKKVLLYFTVPEACDSCLSLEKNVFASAEFYEFASENYILAKADFSGDIDQQTKQDNLLIVEKYNKDGFFPLVVVLDKNSKVLGKSGVYNNELPSDYINKLKLLSRN